MIRKEKLMARFRKTELQKNGIRSPTAQLQMFAGADLVDVCARPEFKAPCKPNQVSTKSFITIQLFCTRLMQKL